MASGDVKGYGKIPTTFTVLVLVFLIVVVLVENTRKETARGDKLTRTHQLDAINIFIHEVDSY